MAIPLNFHEVSKLLIIFAIISLNSELVVRVKAQLLVEPLWNTSITNQCFVNTTGNVTLFQGKSRSHSCSVQVSSPEGSRIQIEINGSLNDDAETLSYLYYKRIDISYECHNKYVNFGELSESCESVINDRNVTVTLQGFVSLYISYVMTETGTSELCPDFVEGGIQHVNDKSTECKDMQGYDSVIKCKIVGYDGNMPIYTNVLPAKCDKILGPRQVTYHCDNDDLSQNFTTLIVYPNDINYLDISFNSLLAVQERSFEGLSQLRVLDLSYNKLNGLPPDVFNTLTSLNTLVLTFNRITDLHVGVFDSLSNLYTLNLSGNRLRSLPYQIFRNRTGLKELFLAWNQITQLNVGVFDSLSNLYRLDLGKNRLRSLPDEIFRNMNNLNTLYLNWNQITELNVFDSLSNLHTLELSGNKLNSLPIEIFRKTVSLNELYLGSNQITELNVGVLDSLSNLDTLDLSLNRLISLPDGTFNNITSTLLTLKLNGNSLDHLPEIIFQKMTSLIHLYLQDNHLTELNVQVFHGLPKLLELHIDENKLHAIVDGVFKNLTNLQTLTLSSNLITLLSAHCFQGLKNLRYLDLNRNELSTLQEKPFRYLNNLESLKLGFNKISQLNQEWFEGLQKLKDLHLNGNMLSRVPDDILLNLATLESLHLSHNPIIQLDLTFSGALQRLESLFLFNNVMEEFHVPQAAYHILEQLKEFSVYLNVQYSDWKILTRIGYLRLFHFAITNVQLLPDILNNISRIELRELHLTHMNQMVRLVPGMFTDFDKVYLLNISKNGLLELNDGDLSGLNDLQKLYAQGNKLKSLHKDVFQSLQQLLWIDLTDNHLTQLDVSVIFTSINFMTRNIEDVLEAFSFGKLDLSNNKLKDIHVSSRDKLRNIETVLYNNPLTSISHDSFSFLGEGSYLLVNQHEVCECYVPDNLQCAATDSRSPYLTCDRLLSDRAVAAVMWLLGLNALCGNLFVLIWRIKQTSSNKVNSLLLSNLATSDFLMGLYMLIIASADIYFGDKFPMYSESWRSGITCSIAGALSIISSEASVFFVTLISIDRFICIRFPFSTKKITKGVAIILAGLIWMLSILLGIVLSFLAGRNFKFYDNSHVCIGLPLALTKRYRIETDRILILLENDLDFYEVSINEPDGLFNGLYFSVAVFLGLNCICYLIILACYIEIVRAVRKSSKRPGQPPDMNEQLRLTTKVTAIVATDLCCWFPIILLGILVQTRVISLSPSVFAWCVTFVLPINSAINPYLYTIAEIISKWKEKKNEVIPLH